MPGAMSSECTTEMNYVDSETYVSVVNRNLRKITLLALCLMSMDRPISKEDIAGGESNCTAKFQRIHAAHHPKKDSWTREETAAEDRLNERRRHAVYQSYPSVIA